jgi:hypothetical protein
MSKFTDTVKKEFFELIPPTLFFFGHSVPVIRCQAPCEYGHPVPGTV